MVQFLLIIKNCLHSFELLGDKGLAGRFIQGIIASFVLALYCVILPSVLGFMMLNFPWFFRFLILTFIMISAITLVLSLPFLLLGEMVPKRIGDEILAVAFVFSILFTISTTSLWWFGSTSLLPESLRAHFFPPKVQFPMGNLNGITVDKKGYIYLGILGYSRIQQYNSKGDFLKGWFINAGGGVFNVWADHSDNIHVRTARTDAHLIFNEDGQLLKTTKIASLEEDEYLAQQASGLRAKDALGNTYSIENLKWSPKVVKINPKGKESILIKDPAYFSLFRHPQPLFSVAFAGLIMSAIIGIIVKFKIHFPEKYRRKTSTNQLLKAFAGVQETKK